MNKVQVPFVDLAAQYAAIKKEVDESIASVLRRTNFILGQDVDLFEPAPPAPVAVEAAQGIGGQGDEGEQDGQRDVVAEGGEELGFDG